MNYFLGRSRFCGGLEEKSITTPVMHPFVENFFFSSDLSSTPSAAAAAARFDFFKKNQI